MPIIIKNKNKNLKIWPKKNFYILDLELTAWENSISTNWIDKNTWREIIQIGALSVTLKDDKFIINDTFNYYVKPKINFKLSKYIINLTGITQSQINKNGFSFEIIFKKLECFFECSGLILFNGLDGQIIYENCLLNNIKKPKWDHRFRNFRPLLSNNLKKPEVELFSSNLPNIAGLTTNLKGHSALNDCKLILKSLNHFKKINLLNDI